MISSSLRPASYVIGLLTLLGTLLGANPLPAAVTTVPSGPSVVKVSGTQLLVQKRNPDGTLAASSPYLIKGVTWDPATAAPTSGPSPTGIGTVAYGFFFDWPGRTPQGHEILDFWKKSQFVSYYKTDLPLMAQMNVNTVRVYSEMGQTPALTLSVLDECYRQGIMVVMTVATSQVELDGNTYVTRVNQYKNHPAILMWALGNEWNLNGYYGYTSMIQAMAATNAAAAAIKNLDPNHPVSSSLGDRFSSRPIRCPANNPCCSSPAPSSDIPAIVAGTPNVDLWGLNMYRGAGFGALFAQWKAATTKPFYMGEFGVDAFYSQSYLFYGCSMLAEVEGRVDQQKQNDYDIGLWQEMATKLSAQDSTQPLIGGFVHQFNDAIWKAGSYHSGLGGTVNYDGPDGIAGTADDDTSYAGYNADGFLIINGFPDHVANEEYFGIVTATRAKRPIYTNLQDLYAALPNILLNGGFERAKSQWGGQGTVDCTVAHSGSCSLNFTAPGAAVATPYVRTIPGQKYTFSGWIRTAITTPSPGVNQGVRINISWYDAYGAFLLHSEDLSPYLNGTHDWQSYTKTRTAPPQAYYARVLCQVAGATTTGSAWFDDLSVVPAK